MLGDVLKAQKLVILDKDGWDVGAYPQNTVYWMRIPKGDTCQKYRDSVAKYDANIKVWERQRNPNMTNLERVAVNALIENLRKQRNEFYEKAKKCKP